MQLNSKKFPTITEAYAQQEAKIALDTTMSTITDVLTRLEKPQTFLYDILNDFFDHYEECKDRDLQNLICMWYAAKHYKVYIESTLEYILTISEELNTLYGKVSTAYNYFYGGAE